jgi:hypothetical protein
LLDGVTRFRLSFFSLPVRLTSASRCLRFCLLDRFPTLGLRVVSFALKAFLGLFHGGSDFVLDLTADLLDELLRLVGHACRFICAVFRFLRYSQCSGLFPTSMLSGSICLSHQGRYRVMTDERHSAHD